MKTTLVVIAALFLATPSWSAETAPPPFDFEASTPAPTLRSPPTVDIRLGALRVQFERTTLSDVQKAVGNGRIKHRGDAGEITYWLCYKGVANSLPVYLWLIAGEIDGPEHTIGVVQLQQATHGSLSLAECPPLPQRLRHISVGRVAALGLTPIEAASRLGEPSSKDNDTLNYFYLGKTPGKYQGEAVEFDRGNFLSLRLAAGKVVGIVISQSTTY